jgi:hypothetical protein
MMFSEDFGACFSTCKNQSRTRGYKWGLLKVRKENTKGPWWGTGGERTCFSFSGVFKTYWGGKAQEIPT